MPEVILPKMEHCPCCNTSSVMLMKDQTYLEAPFYVQCGALCHRKHVTASATPEEAMAKWNALPRALRWTHEPPKVAGWYWRRNVTAKDVYRVCRVYCCDDTYLFPSSEWAGPIPAPID